MVKTVLVALAGGLLLHADENRVKAEPNLEKRSRLAIVAAEASLNAAKTAYNAGDLQGAEGRIDDVARYTELAFASLRETGKNPRRSPKHFKHVEIKSRELLRRLDALAQEMDAADRHLADPAKERIRKVNEEILAGIMGKK